MPLQWAQTISTARGAPCQRSVYAQDGSTKDEVFNCMRVSHFDYIKNWRPFRVNSMFFDQPGAHYNPMRDPFPSLYMPSTDVLLDITTTEGTATKIAISQGLIEINKSPWSWVDFGRYESSNSGSWSSIIGSWIEPSASRVETLQSLQDNQLSTAAAQGFYFIGNGYFFSAFNADVATMAAKYLMGSLEGSLFDWQIGDFLSSCTAGDIRVHFKIQDPGVVSVIGRLVESEGGLLSLDTFSTLSEQNAGCLQGGAWSAQELLDNRVSEFKWRRMAAIASLLPFSYFVARLLGAWRGLELRAGHGAPHPTSKLVVLFHVLAVWMLALFAIWISVWNFEVGPKHEAPILVLMAAALLQYASQKTAKASTASGPRAAWCMLARAAGLPSTWRVESTNVSGSAKAVPIEQAEARTTHEAHTRKSPRKKAE